MRVLVRHGHFAFYPKKSGDLARFMALYDLELERVPGEDFYTFPRLVEAPDYCLPTRPLLNLAATKTFEGRPWEVMRENGYVYHIAGGILIPKASVTSVIDLPLVGDYYLAENSLIQPGSRLATGEVILSYDGEFLQEKAQFRITGVDSE